MKRIATLVAVLLAATLYAAAPPWYTSGAGTAVGPVNTTISFTDNHSGGTSAAFLARWVHLRSDAASDSCYVDFADGVATTADMKIVASQDYTWVAPAGYNPTMGLASIGVICAGTAAYKNATYTDANVPDAGDTLVITDGATPKTYTFVAAVAVEGDVKIGTADATIANLVNAINGVAGAGNAVAGNYLVAAENPLVSATQDTAGAGTGTLTITARVKGTAGASIAGNGTFATGDFFADFTLNTGGGTQDDATFYVEATR